MSDDVLVDALLKENDELRQSLAIQMIDTAEAKIDLVEKILDYDSLFTKWVIFSEYIDEMERFGPVFGPVDGTGRPDPKGDMMVDMPMESLIKDLRDIYNGTYGQTTSKPRRPRREQ